MNNIDTIIKGFLCCTNHDDDYNPCQDCPYTEYGRKCADTLRADVVGTLRAYEALVLYSKPKVRVMTLDEVISVSHEPELNGRYTEMFNDNNDSPCFAILFPALIRMRDGELIFSDGKCCDIAIPIEAYGTEVRCWTSMPTQDQMDNTPWDEKDQEVDDEHPRLEDVVFVSKDDGQWCVNMRNDFFEQDDIKYLMEHRSDGGCDALTLFELISINAADAGGIICCDDPYPDLFEYISKRTGLNNEVVLRGLPLLLERQMITVRDGKYVVPISFESDE